MLLLPRQLLPPGMLQRCLQPLTHLLPLRTPTIVEGKMKKTGRKRETKFPSHSKLEVSQFLLVGRPWRAATEAATILWAAAGSRGDAALQIMPGTLPAVLEGNTSKTQPQGSQGCLSTSKSVFKVTMGENGYLLVENYLVMTINPS